MATCPAGHASADDEFCDVCGRAMDGPAPTAAPPASEPEAVAVPEGEGTCVVCGSALPGRFCEECGHDSLAAAPDTAGASGSGGPGGAARAAADVPAAATRWALIVRADRRQFDAVVAASGPDAGSLSFPPYCPDRHFPLRGGQVSIGRRSQSRGIVPDVDLTGPPEDPGVSHLHAVLVAGDGGSWSIVDLESANGTTVNGGHDPLPPNVPHPLADGDTVYIGAWTAIQIRAT
ncbi:FHA domain-containing protein [Saccharomonospora sp. NPDC006951]